MNDRDRYLSTQQRIEKRRNEDIATARRWFINIMGGVILLIVIWDLLFGRLAGASEFESHDGCSNCFSYFDSTPRVWNGAVDVYFNPEGLPSWLAIPDIEREIERNLDYLSLYVTHPLRYAGRASYGFINGYSASRRNTIVFGFENTGFLGRADIWWNWEGTNNVNYGEVKLSPNIVDRQIAGTVLHELVHTLDIDHNLDSPHSIMSVPYNSIEYQATLRLDDILAIQSLYPAKPNMQGVITSFDGSVACSYQPVAIFETVTAQGLTLCGTITSATTEE